MKRVQNYDIVRRLGQGSFGTVYLAQVHGQPHKLVAMKIERISGPKACKVPQLAYEKRVYQELCKDKNHGQYGIPRLFWGGEWAGKYDCLATQLFETDLETLFRGQRARFTRRAILDLAVQFCESLWFLHSKGFIHRDIKPQNWCVAAGRGRMKPYLIDYGLAKKFIDSNGLHIPFRDGKSLTGTPRYASIPCMQGIEQSRRDDMEAILYQIIYLFKGKLPWQGLRGGNGSKKKEKHARILQCKLETPLRELCRGCPSSVRRILARVKSMSFTEEPRYARFVQALAEDRDRGTHGTACAR